MDTAIFRAFKCYRDRLKKELKEFKNFVNKFKDDIVQKWIDYFVYHKSIECIKIEGKVK